MFNKIFVTTLFFLSLITVNAQEIDKIINATEVERIERILSADDMEGRKTFSPGIEKAAAFIESEFGNAGLKYFDTLKSYRQSFEWIRTKFASASGSVNGAAVDQANIFALTTDSLLKFDANSGYEKKYLAADADLFTETSKLLNENKRYIVFINTAASKNFNSLKTLRRPAFESKPPVVFVLTDEQAEKYNFEIKYDVARSTLANVVGVLPGKSKKDEVVIFSGHYDHLGIGKPNAAGDSIYNGANDDAAGTTAVMMLAKYFSALNNNERTLIFVAFTAEESGGYGSGFFTQQIDADKTIAMFNMEMIGTESKWGKNSAYITGYEKSDFGKILQRNLAGTNFKFEPDPYPKQNLFYRSDNARLAAVGVPAHTISTSKMDEEKFYHTQEDEIETLNMQNMAEIIKAIALSSKGIVSGKETPSRVEKGK